MKIRLGGIFCHGYLHYDPERFRGWMKGGGGSCPDPQVENVGGDMWVTLECLPRGDVLVAPVLCQWAPRHKRLWNTLPSRDWWVGCRVEMTNLKVKVDTGRAVWRRIEEIQKRSVIEYLRPDDVKRCWAKFDERQRPFMRSMAEDFARSLGEPVADMEKDLGVLMRIIREMFVRRGEFDVAALPDEQLFYYFGVLYRRTH